MIRQRYEARYRLPDLARAMAGLGNLISGIHPACETVAPIGRRDFDNLVDSIKQHGLLRPIEVNADRQLVDGRSRIMACYVAQVPVTRSHIVETSADPTAIAASNTARRHLTIDQRAMFATELLQAARFDAKKRKVEGAKLGRELQRQPLATDVVASRNKSKRQQTAADQIASQERVPRDKLLLSERLQKANPTLAAKVKSGDMPLNEAAKIAGVSIIRKRQVAKQADPSTTSPVKQIVKSGKSGGKILFDDRGVTITRSTNGIRMIRNRDVTLYCHDDVDVTVMVYGGDGDDNSWLVGLSDRTDHISGSTREAAEAEAIELAKSMITTAS